MAMRTDIANAVWQFIADLTVTAFERSSRLHSATVDVANAVPAQ